MITRKEWVEMSIKGNHALCMHPEWLKQGCPKCNNTKWIFNGLVATCKFCKYETETLYPFGEFSDVTRKLEIVIDELSNKTHEIEWIRNWIKTNVDTPTQLKFALDLQTMKSIGDE